MNLSGLYGELGRFSLSIFRQISMVRYWIKLITTSDNVLPKKVYIMLKNDTDNNRTCIWVKLGVSDKKCFR